MPTIVRLAVSLDEEAGGVARRLNRPTSSPAMWSQYVINLLAGMASGHRRGNVRQVIEDATATAQATETITCVQANADDGDTVTLGTQALASETTPVDEDDFDPGASDTTMATALAAAINAHTKLSSVVTATSAAGVVTVTYNTPGESGNHFPLATSDATAFTLGGTALSGGGATTNEVPSAQYKFGGG